MEEEVTFIIWVKLFLFYKWKKVFQEESEIQLSHLQVSFLDQSSTTLQRGGGGATFSGTDDDIQSKSIESGSHISDTYENDHHPSLLYQMKVQAKINNRIREQRLIRFIHWINIILSGKKIAKRSADTSSDLYHDQLIEIIALNCSDYAKFQRDCELAIR